MVLTQRCVDAQPDKDTWMSIQPTGSASWPRMAMGGFGLDIRGPGLSLGMISHP